MLFADQLYAVVDHVCELVHMHPVFIGDSAAKIQGNRLCQLLIHILNGLRGYLRTKDPRRFGLRNRLRPDGTVRFLPLPVFWIIKEAAEMNTDHSPLCRDSFRSSVTDAAGMIHDLVKAAVTVDHR